MIMSQVATLAVVGIGLIGGSFAADLRAGGVVARVVGVGRHPATLARALELGLIDEIVDAQTAARTADVILLATPVGAMQAVLAIMAPHLRPSTVLTDAGSTKIDVITAARAALGERAGQFVPGHPIAGAHSTGPDAARLGLFSGRRVILTPIAENTEASVAIVQRLWEACGANVQRMTPDTHDAVLASVSHMPHLLSAVYMAQVASADDAQVRLAHAGTGFRDFTRIAAGSPEMWRDIFLSNAGPMRTELAAVRVLLDEMDDALARGDGHALETLLEIAARARNAWDASRPS